VNTVTKKKERTGTSKGIDVTSRHLLKKGTVMYIVGEGLKRP
jgi:hypothetical protein